MRRSAPVDGFQLAYRHRQPGPTAGPGARPAPGVVLLHGWPGDSTDHRLVEPLLDPGMQVVVPDLRGFGGSDRHPGEPDAAYGAAAQARSVAGLIEELQLSRPVVAGYDIGSRVAQRLAADRPELVGALVLSPPLPGAGRRVLDAASEPGLWYQGFHRSGLAARLVDGDAGRVRAYLAHFWAHWSGPGFALTGEDLDHLVSVYSPPGALTASTRWYRAGPGYVAAALAESAPAPAGRLGVPAHVLWQEHDPLFPPAWADRLGEFFADVTLTPVPGAGHFIPLEAPGAVAAAIHHAAARVR